MKYDTAIACSQSYVLLLICQMSSFLLDKLDKLTLKILKMNTKEFRIGNFVNDTDDTFHIVSAVYRNGIEMEFNDLRYFMDEDVVRPILLTEELVLKFGFTKIGRVQFHSDIFWAISNYKEQGFWCNQLECYIKYVHQLQNLYFALTGVELQLSST